MKRIKIFVIMLIAGVLGGGCTRNFEETNRNPNSPDQLNPEYLFNSSVYYTLNAFSGEMKKRLLGNYCHYYWGSSDQMGRYGNFPSSNDTYWRRAYNEALFPVRYIQDRKTGDASYRNRLIIARIWENYIFSQIVSIWGNVPKTHALKASQKVPYDREEYIYYELLDDLKACAEGLDLSGDRYQNDPVYPSSDKSSDLLKWKKFANSLRFRLAVRISNDAPNGNPQKARAVISELMEDESAMISGAEDNCVVKWGSTSATRNYFYDYMIVEREANKDKLNTAGESILQHMAPYGDPRIPKFFTEANPLQMPAGFVWAPYWGEPKNSSTPPGVTINPNPHSGKTSEDYSMMQDAFFVADYAEVLFCYAEMCLLKCEAVYRGLTDRGNTAESYYNAGIEASMAQYGVTASETADYLRVPGIAWGTLSDLSEGETKYQDWLGITSSAIKADDPDPVYRQIVMQQYIALFYQSLEAWTLIRRTQVLEFPPHLSPDTGNGAVTPTGKTFAYIPQRLVYPDNETLNNNDELQKAIGWMDGGDRMSTKLWFAKPTKENPYL
ncbi:SusD/RagB family nutrient-binding outer membrane lipoprotein [Gallalistipes aquisgranensis]|uniref:SusD/RagB family nutrient-binding outer membrane lipoprotein n=1 Tax=Gallalistipes aquisgranensis TaxID=2779358 RepID=UPI001CF86604|nr:SusD/RagB family nutrient-binding outer membrane lipoprotein [Gallalistipes aquisgranensis]MBE5034398.1 SusD/RagB family nutrient-binding outer membrane lipoprotein [Gallalistipes aquisgranensis]